MYNKLFTFSLYIPKLLFFVSLLLWWEKYFYIQNFCVIPKCKIDTQFYLLENYVYNQHSKISFSLGKHEWMNETVSQILE